MQKDTRPEALGTWGQEVKAGERDHLWPSGSFQIKYNRPRGIEPADIPGGKDRHTKQNVKRK